VNIVTVTTRTWCIIGRSSRGGDPDRMVLYYTVGGGVLSVIRARHGGQRRHRECRLGLASAGDDDEYGI
jgi:hypothetical protein